MEIHQLRYFCAIAETGSFSRAAVKNHISQPSLSQQIRKLEDELGVKLFDRLGRSVRLTEFGQSFLPRARTVLRDLEVARSEVAEKNASGSGSICIGVIPTIAPYFLPEVLPKFSREWPQARVSVVEEITPRLLEKLREGSIDIAIVALPLQVHGHEFEAHMLMTEKLLAVLPRKHMLADHRFHFANWNRIPSFCCAMVTVSGRLLWPPAIALGLIPMWYLKAVSSAASSVWCRRGLEFRSFRKWRSKNVPDAAFCHCPTSTPQEPLGL